MSGLILKSNGTDRIFRSDGKVVIASADGTETIKGEWNTAAKRDTNRIHYDFDDTEAEFDVTYAFNKNNQLVATIPAANGGTNSQPFAFPGRIVIDGNRDVSYELFTEAGEPTRAKIVVHGDLSFAPGLDKLIVTLPGGGTTEIRGGKAGTKALETAPSGTAAGPGGDLVQFSATTLNTFDDVPLATRAIILFVGRWGMNDKGLVFNVGLNAGEVAIQFGGTYKGVTVGLAYYAKDGDPEFAFTIHGEHQFKHGAGSVNWLMSLGHSKEKIEAVAELELTSPIGKAGNKLTLGGKFQFVSEPGKKAPPRMDISLDATYEMNGSQLIFAADFQNNGDRSSYNLRLAGNYEVKGGNVKFLVQLSKDATGQTLAVELGSVTDRNVQLHLSAVLSKSNSGKVSLSANFTISARWVNGDKMEIDKPVMST